MASNLSDEFLASLLFEWYALLQGWAADGSLMAAAQEALLLNETPEALEELAAQWAKGDFSALPPIVLLSSADISGAMGAYAISTGTICLDSDWLGTASLDQVNAVLTEELGHHLDNLLNEEETLGDEGELFAALLNRDGLVGTQERQLMLDENDQGTVLVNGVMIAVEQSAVTRTPIRASRWNATSGEYNNGYAFAALKADGSVVTWGSNGDGGDSSGVAGQLSSGVVQIFSTGSAFAALKVDGSVVTWGSAVYGGDSRPWGADGQPGSGVAGQLSSGVTQIFSNHAAFAALKADGSVVTWGKWIIGPYSIGVAGQLSSGVTQIFSTSSAFAALKADGSVVTWGNSFQGGDSSGVAGQLNSGVTQIFSTDESFAALKAGGSVVTWGNSGGNSSGVASQLSSGVIEIFASGQAFAALKVDGSVVTWGNPISGGDSSGVAGQLSSGVVQIFSTGEAFAALKADGSVVTWGSAVYGGDSSGVAGQLSSSVTQIFSNYSAFAALKADGSVVTWGSNGDGGNSSGVAGQLSSGVTQIFSNSSAFAALKVDGSVVTWGSAVYGGDSSGVAGQLSSGVTQIFSNRNAFAALKSDGSVVTWGGGAAETAVGWPVSSPTWLLSQIRSQMIDFLSSMSVTALLVL